METLKIHQETLSSRFMYSIISTKLSPKLVHISSQLRTISTTSLNLTNTNTTKKTVLKNSVRTSAKFTDAQLKENWLASLSCPKLVKTDKDYDDGSDGDVRLPCNVGEHELVIGIDPDLSGALALLKSDHLGCTPQVFDSPVLQIMVGNKVRRRLDASSIVKLLQSFDAPVGTVVYLEQSNPFPQDGKQGWWSGGFGYGLWIGVLVASGFSVVPVPACKWKNEFELSGSHSTKDDSRRLASTLFPSMSSILTRKKDHGRAEALLIAAYGKGMKIKPNSSCNSQESVMPEILASC